MKLIALSVLASAACAFAFQANQANAVTSVASPQKAPVAVEANPSFWNVVGTKAYMGGESGVDEQNVKPSYNELAQAWLQ